MPSENKRIVITGGPGSGKNTLLDALRVRGFPTVAETGRAIIRDQVANGGNALPWKDRVAFAELMLNRELCSWHAAARSRTPFFFDRGLPDVAGYLTLCNLPDPSQVERAIELFRQADIHNFAKLNQACCVKGGVCSVILTFVSPCLIRFLKRPL